MNILRRCGTCRKMRFRLHVASLDVPGFGKVELKGKLLCRPCISKVKETIPHGQQEFRPTHEPGSDFDHQAG